MLAKEQSKESRLFEIIFSLISLLKLDYGRYAKFFIPILWICIQYLICN